jgi:prepilin-type N-terminal cleavage/methylation domain-containing protein
VKKLNQSGFTLLEVLIAFIILAGSMLVLLQSRSSSVNAIVKGKTYTNVTFLLQSKMTEFEIKNRNKTVEEIEESQAGSFDGFPDYSWEIKLRPMVIPNVFPKNENADAQQAQMVEMIVRTITEYFEKAVREVLVTVKDKRQKKSYSVTTIFIDYTKPLPVGGGP